MERENRNQIEFPFFFCCFSLIGFLCPGSMEDLTDPERLRTDPKSDRTVSLYGYLRGTHMKNQGQVHIPGK